MDTVANLKYLLSSWEKAGSPGADRPSLEEIESPAVRQLAEEVESSRSKFIAAMEDDFNTPEPLPRCLSWPEHQCFSRADGKLNR